LPAADDDFGSPEIKAVDLDKDLPPVPPFKNDKATVPLSAGVKTAAFDYMFADADETEVITIDDDESEAEVSSIDDDDFESLGEFFR
jgi:hypothetical protein